nr:MAG: replication associated protein [Cressdnaviricota sp.]
MADRRQGIFWILTIPFADYSPPDSLPNNIVWLRGQHEISHTGYSHWQIFVAFSSKKSERTAKQFFTRTTHVELSRSEAAEEYVWKEDTRVAGSQFELGAKPIRRNSRVDWESVWSAAIRRDLAAIPANIRVTSYRQLLAIAADHDQAPPRPHVMCTVFWGKTGTGKSRRAWEEAGSEAYSKDPRSKFWCSYRAQKNVVIDEFRGGIDISHLLRWLDRYPVELEIKGSSRPLQAINFWITSNLEPVFWYCDADQETKDALMRRLTVIEMNEDLLVI